VKTRRYLRFGVLFAIGATVAGAVPATAAVAAGGGSGQPTAAAAGAAPLGPGRPLLLINGDRLMLQAGAAGQQVAVRPAARQDSIVGLRAGGQLREIPAVAMPFIGRGLSLALFQISALEKAEAHGRLPVQVSFTGHRPPLPGITVTRSSAGTATGYLTPSSARAFGAALRRQYLADHARGSYGRDGLFSHGVQISLVGTAPLPESPGFPMHTLTVHATDLKGRPDTGDSVFIASADNASRFFPLAGSTNFFVRGSTRFSVPGGHYMAVAQFTTGNSVRLVVLPQFTVSGAHSTVRISEKAASSKVSAPTPRPAANSEITFEIVRGEKQGGPLSSTEFVSGAMSLWVNPTTRKPTVGTMRTFTSVTKLSPAGASPGYAYNLDFPGPDGRIGSQHFTVPASSLATVTENYYDDVATKQGGWAAFGGTLRQLTEGVDLAFINPLPLPQVQTQYFTAGPQMLWQNEFFTGLRSLFDGDIDVFRSYAPGQAQSQDWNRYPLHPAPDSRPAGTAAVSLGEVSAAREGNTLLLSPVPFTDNQPGHLGEGFFGGNRKVTGSFTVDENGIRIAHGNARNGIPGIRLSPKSSSMRLVLAASRPFGPFRLSPSSRTVWAWRSVRDTAARVPAAWFCSVTHQFTLDRRCAVQPLMTLNYLVQGESLSGLTVPGPQVIDLSVGHFPPGSALAVRGATAQVSFNGGHTWQQATVATQGGGQFQVRYPAAAGAAVTLRVGATDAAGGSVTETIRHAYGVSQAAAVSPQGAAVSVQAATSLQPAASPHTATSLQSAASPQSAKLSRAATAGLRRACPTASAGRISCFALYRPQYAVNQAVAKGHQAQPAGWGPKALERAYRLPVSRDSHQTIAVSVAFHAPSLAKYLKIYREHYGLPPCTTASGCLRIVNQNGKAAPHPKSGRGSGWDLEATLDVSMVSAACPHCRILVVEADSNFDGDLARTDATAARLGADVISNSYGTRENGQTQTLRKDYLQPGHMVVASSGDFGFDAANFPANLGGVTAVGGTELRHAASRRGVTERVWNQPGGLAAGTSSCSAYAAKPAWQHDPHCPGRTVADVSAVAADVPIFNKFYGGWVTVGGTSVAAPFISGVFGLAGNATSISPRYLYRHKADFFDITRGNNVIFGRPAAVCGGDYLCQAQKGYDAPTGLGTPDGIAGF
jgi:hypothetical protein